jgi:hypothetical protein
LSTPTSAAGSTITGSGTNHLVITGTLAQVNADLAALHDTNTTAGVDNITVTATDSFGNTASAASIAVTITSELTIPAGATSSYNGGTITVNVDNDGTLEAISHHTLTITGDIMSTGTLTGTLSIVNSATLVLDGDVSGQNIVFGIGSGTTPELVLGDPNDFAASSSISSFGVNDTIDLPTLAYAGGATPTSIKGVLGTPETMTVGGSETITVFVESSTLTVITISEGTTTAVLHLTGTNYNNITFTFSRDAGTPTPGTQFVDPLAIDSGTTLELQSASAENVCFINNAGNTGTLILDDPVTFSGLIYGFTGTGTVSDAIDLKGITFDSGTTWKYTENSAGTGGTLTLYKGTTIIDTINFVGSYTTANFTVGSDGNGGTLITDSLSGSAATIAGDKLIIDAQSNVNITFNNSTAYGELVLSDAPGFTGQISGFTGTAPNLASSDAIDLTDINFGNLTTKTYTPNGAGTGGTLTVADGTNTATLYFSGDYSLANFSFASDGQGGTLITDPPQDGTVTSTGSSSNLSTDSPSTTTSTDSPSTTISTDSLSKTTWTDSSSTIGLDDRTAKYSTLNPLPQALQDPADHALPHLSDLPAQGLNNPIAQQLLGGHLTDIAFSANTTLGYGPNAGGIGGAPSLGDGTHNASIALFNQYAAAGFQLGNNNNGALVTQPLSLASENEMLITNPNHKR